MQGLHQKGQESIWKGPGEFSLRIRKDKNTIDESVSNVCLFTFSLNKTYAYVQVSWKHLEQLIEIFQTFCGDWSEALKFCEGSLFSTHIAKDLNSSTRKQNRTCLMHMLQHGPCLSNGLTTAPHFHVINEEMREQQIDHSNRKYLCRKPDILRTFLELLTGNTACIQNSERWILEIDEAWKQAESGYETASQPAERERMDKESSCIQNLELVSQAHLERLELPRWRIISGAIEQLKNIIVSLARNTCGVYPII